MDFLAIVPLLGCGLMMVMMVVMMWSMGKDMLGRDKKPDESSVDELRAENERLAERLQQLEGREERERIPNSV